MIKMNFYRHGTETVTTADLLRGCSHSLVRIADSMDKPNELLAMFNEVFDVVTREKVAEKIESLAANLLECSVDLRGPIIDQRLDQRPVR
jgi:hypothetical protein